MRINDGEGTEQSVGGRLLKAAAAATGSALSWFSLSPPRRLIRVTVRRVGERRYVRYFVDAWRRSRN